MKQLYFALMAVLAVLTGQVSAQEAGQPAQDNTAISFLALAGSLPGATPQGDIPQSPAPAAVLAGISPEKLKTETLILFRVSGAPGSETAVRLCICNQAGREVAVLVDDLLEPDSYQVRWNGRDNSESPVSNGLYFTRLAAAGRVVTQKMTVAR